MITLTYVTDFENLDFEIEWLNDQRIYPAVREFFTWDDTSQNAKRMAEIGMIVSSEDALAIKLRKSLRIQHLWKRP